MHSEAINEAFNEAGLEVASGEIIPGGVAPERIQWLAGHTSPDEQAAGDGGEIEDAVMLPPRFTLTVQMDGSPGSQALLDGLTKGIEGGRLGSGPDLVVLAPQQIRMNARRADEQPVAGTAQVGFQFATTLHAVPDGIGCVIGSVFISLPAGGVLSQFRDEIARSNAALGMKLPTGREWRLTAEDAAPENDRELPDAASMSAHGHNAGGQHGGGRNGGGNGTTGYGEAVADLETRAARVEGALINRRMARWEERLAALPTREELASLATRDEMNLAVDAIVNGALEPMIERIAQQAQALADLPTKADIAQAVADGLQPYVRRLDEVARENDDLKAELARRRWWRLWQR